MRNDEELTRPPADSDEGRYRALLQSLDEGFALIKILLNDRGEPADYRFLDINRTFSEHTGLVDPVGRTALEMLPNLDPWWVETYGRVALTGESTRFENHARAMNRWFDVFAYRIGPAERREVALVFRNITARKKLEARERFLRDMDDAVRPLSGSEAITLTYARLLGEHLHVDRCAFADVENDQDMMNLSGNYTRPGVQSIVGRYPFSAFGQHVLQLMRENRPYVVDDIDHFRPAPGSLEAYRRTAIRAVICVPLHKAGRFVAAMAVHMSTPRQWRADEVELVQLVAGRCWESIERVRILRELRVADRLFREMADTAPAILWVTDPEGHCNFLSRSWYDFTGQNEAQAMGFGWLDTVHPDDRERARETFLAANAAHQPFAMDIRFRRADGVYRWSLDAGRPRIDAAGQFIGYVGSVIDITDRKEAEQRREQLLAVEREARAEAERVGRMKDEFLATLSHELRTPLNAILGWSQLVARPGGSAADLREGLAAIERNARAQAQLIEDLLDMSRIISGKVRIEVQQVNLLDVVEAAMASSRPAAEAKGVRLSSVLDTDVGPVSGDPNRLQQVIWNLLSNAIKFTPRGGRVQVVLARINSHLELSVSDTGQGIAPDFLPHVFERFRQADASTTRQHGGLGLGLAIAKHLVELHGGTIRARSDGLGLGSTFIVALPRMVVSADGGKRPVAVTPTFHCETPGLKGVKVLVVDDELDARTLLARVLADCEAEILAADGAEAAVELFARHRPDVLVSDIGMPGVDGYELLRRIRAVDGGAQVPAAALTAFARPEDRTRALLAGYQMHLSKPVDAMELVATVAALAGRTGGVR